MRVQAGLDDGRVSAHDDRLLEHRVAVAADDDVDARHLLRQGHIASGRVGAVRVLEQAAVAKGDDHVDLLGLAQELDHLLAGLDGVREGDRAGAGGVEDGLLAHEPEETEAQAAALDHGVPANGLVAGEGLQAGERGIAAAEVGVRGDYRGDAARLGGDADRRGHAFRPKVVVVVAEGGRVVAHQRHELQLGAGLADGGAEGGAHAVVAGVEDEDGTLGLARLLSLRDHAWPGGQSRRGSHRR